MVLRNLHAHWLKECVHAYKGVLQGLVLIRAYPLCVKIIRISFFTDKSELTIIIRHNLNICLQKFSYHGVKHNISGFTRI